MEAMRMRVYKKEDKEEEGISAGALLPERKPFVLPSNKKKARGGKKWCKG